MSKPTDTHSPRGQSPADRLIEANRILIGVHDADIIDDPRLGQAIGILAETIAARQKAETEVYRTLYGGGS